MLNDNKIMDLIGILWALASQGLEYFLSLFYCIKTNEMLRNHWKVKHLNYKFHIKILLPNVNS